jgi:hypothetical protein
VVLLVKEVLLEVTSLVRLMQEEPMVLVMLVEEL